MTKKDFEFLAATLRDEIETCVAMYEPTSAAAVARYAETLGEALERTHPRFDRDRFLKACGTELAFS